jgi:hypothetical protein
MREELRELEKRKAGQLAELLGEGRGLHHLLAICQTCGIEQEERT